MIYVRGHHKHHGCVQYRGGAQITKDDGTLQ